MNSFNQLLGMGSPSQQDKGKHTNRHTNRHRHTQTETHTPLPPQTQNLTHQRAQEQVSMITLVNYMLCLASVNLVLRPLSSMTLDSITAQGLYPAYWGVRQHRAGLWPRSGHATLSVLYPVKRSLAENFIISSSTGGNERRCVMAHSIDMHPSVSLSAWVLLPLYPTIHTRPTGCLCSC